MSTYLPRDSNNHPIQALSLRPSGAHAISAGAVSARNTLAFSGDTHVVSLYATVPVFVKFGDSGVMASSSSHYFPAGVYYDFSIGGGDMAQFTHVAVLAFSGTGSVYVSEKI
jgi:hypothetical protein